MEINSSGNAKPISRWAATAWSSSMQCRALAEFLLPGLDISWQTCHREKAPCGFYPFDLLIHGNSFFVYTEPIHLANLDSSPVGSIDVKHAGSDSTQYVKVVPVALLV